ncbi:hypothetical protein BELL_0003g00070 [Botrytis elliptica]|uniref:Uncharacterized protein n=1 Tax=Botrytis elliptica TaxID=278938 RepID=A0A4Z1K971_9HELO|nr:hypothetical protein EAE99_009954 [Botrytis elliptica]TGO80640.1 hypothetical protein BELL_0003g00070 [Botrytis elliptica]
MPKTKAAAKSAQNVQQKQKQKLKTEQKSKMTTTPVGRTAKPTPSLDITRSNSNSNAKTTRNSKSNAFTNSAIRASRNNAESMSNSTPTPEPKTNVSLVTKSTPETQKPMTKPTYPKPLVIWHVKPSKKIWLSKRNRKRNSETTSLKNKAESTTHPIPTPTPKTKTESTPVGGNVKSNPSPETQEPIPKPTYPKPLVIWHKKPNQKRSSKPTNSKKNTESTTNPTQILKQKANTSSAGRNAQPKSSPENRKSIPKAKLTRNSGLNGVRSSEIATAKKDAETLAPVIAGRMIIEISDSDDDDTDGDGDLYVDDDIDADEVGDVDVDEDVNLDEDNDANTTPQSIPMHSPTLDETPDMVLIPNINAAPASPHLGDLDPMPWMPEVEAGPALALDAGLENSTLDATSNIMGLIPNANATPASLYRGDLMLSGSEVELELPSGLGNQVAGDKILVSDDMDMDMDSHLDSHMDMDINMNADTEINTSPFQTSWEGMYMDPPLTAEEKGWDFSSVGIEEIDGLFEEMEKEMSGDMDVEMEMGE